VIATGSSRDTSRLFRDVMSRFCTGVAIVTSCDDNGHPVGLTCQSVASVSLNPPLVLFCGGKGSTSLPRILAADRFCINILGDSHHDMAAQFAVSGADKFAYGDWRLSREGMPQLEDALARIECSVESVYPAGDHDIVVGRVKSVEAGDGAMPLLFYRSEFRLVGRALSLDPPAIASARRTARLSA
jgi:3-hydroxy-9,10-secoandrosta-1,3,5(10)-triene-9,17-dione monooxygenase reductase component